jgi:ABC-type Zn uptake system ZnuABC Zn-binding protein ZnuA
LTVLMRADSDPHSFVPNIGQMARVAEADIVFVNGWDLEERLVDELANIGGDAVMVPVSAGIVPRAYQHEGLEQPDPHVWHNPLLVHKWAENIAVALTALAPARAPEYEANRAAYAAELELLDAYSKDRLSTVPAPARVLVTNHDAFGYFADAYGFRLVGTVIPGLSTLSEPSAGDLTALVRTMQEEGVCHVFSDTAANPSLAEAVLRELKTCEEVSVVAMYAGALGPEGSGADSYVGMYRANIDAIVSALDQENEAQANARLLASIEE